MTEYNNREVRTIYPYRVGKTDAFLGILFFSGGLVFIQDDLIKYLKETSLIDLALNGPTEFYLLTFFSLICIYFVVAGFLKFFRPARCLIFNDTDLEFPFYNQNKTILYSNISYFRYLKLPIPTILIAYKDIKNQRIKKIYISYVDLKNRADFSKILEELHRRILVK